MPIKKGFLIVVLIYLMPPSSITLLADNTSNEMIGMKAPMITGKNANGSGLLNLRKLMTEIGYEKDKDGKFIEKNGKYILQVKKNVVVLNFFSMACIPCIKEIPTYNKLAVKYKNLPVKLIYVNVDAEVTDLKIKRFIVRKQIKVSMMLPNQREAMRKYQAYALPRLVVINSEGRIVEIITGFNDYLEAELITLIDKLIG
jgi:thiol-disulfide isomerase/thioredoxin